MNIVREIDFQDYIDAGFKVVPLLKGRTCVLGDVDYTRKGLARYWVDEVEHDGIGLVLENDIAAIVVKSSDIEMLQKVVDNFESEVYLQVKDITIIFFRGDGLNTQSVYKFEMPASLGFVTVMYYGTVPLDRTFHSTYNYYEWGMEFDSLIKGELKKISTLHVEKIGAILNASTLSVVNMGLPSGSQFVSYDLCEAQLEAAFVDLAKRKKGQVNEVISALLDVDSLNYGKNSYFLCTRFDGTSREVNALTFYQKMIKKHDLSISTNAMIDNQTIRFNEFTRIDPAVKFEEKDFPIFDISLVPGIWIDYFIKLEESYGTPVHVSLMTHLCTLGSCIQGNTIIKPYASDPFFKRPNIAVCISAPSGSKKSDIMTRSLDPIQTIQSEVSRSNSKEDYLLHENLSLEILALGKKKSALIAKGEEYDFLDDEIKSKQDEMDKRKLKGTKFLYENATIQKMIDDIHDNQETGLMVVKDEFKQIMIDIAKIGNEDARSLYMKAVDGTLSHRYSTKKNGDVLIDHVFFSLMSCVQPDVLYKYISELDTIRGSNDGFIQRILFIPLGDVVVKRRVPFDASRHLKIKEIYFDSFHLSKRVLTLSEESIELYENIRLDVCVNAKRYSALPVGSSLAKLEGLICVFAAQYETIKDKHSKSISLESMLMSQKMIRYLTATALYIFGVKNKKSSRDLIEQLATYISSRHVINGTTVSQFFQQFKQYRVDIKEFNFAIQELVARGYLQLTINQARSEVVHVNPLAYDRT